MITNTWPLDIHVKYLQACSFMRTRGFEKFNSNEMYTDINCQKGHRQHIEEWLYKIGCDAHNILDIKLDEIPRQFIWEKSFSVLKGSMEKGKAEFGNPVKGAEMEIFTDGSKGGKGGLAGAGVAPYRNVDGESVTCEAGGPEWNSFHLEKSPIFLAEMYAIFRAANYAREFAADRYKINKVNIFTDNQGCVYSLDDFETNSETVLKTVNELNAACRSGLTVSVSWVKAHRNCIGNIVADELANIGRQDINNPAPDAPKTPFSYIKYLFRKGATRFWNQRWAEQGRQNPPLARQTRLWFPECRPDFSARIMLRDRLCLSKYILLMTGHNFWNRHEWLVTRQRYRKGHIPWEQVVSPICDYCQTWTTIDPDYKEGEDGRPTQTTEHIFSDCEGFASLRNEIFGEYCGTMLHEIPINKILKFIEAAGFKDLIPKDHNEVKEISTNSLEDEEDI